MPRKNPPTGTDADLNLSSMLPLFSNEKAAIAFVESKCWPNGPVCPHCCGREAYPIESKPGAKRPVRPGLRKCKACRKPFTVRVGTIFEDSKIPLAKWLMAIHLMTSSKKGISSHQLSRELDITQKAAWFLEMRIREAMRKDSPLGELAGTVEADETYVGGRPRPANGLPGTNKPKRGRGTSKQAVMVLVERDGKAFAKTIVKVDGRTLKGTIRECVNPSATIMTDEFSSYRGVGKHFAGGHHTVNHSQKEYVRQTPCGDVFVTTNTAESYFALLKRGHYGIFHQLSKQHLDRYCHEFTFRWDHRKVSDGQRMVEAIKGAEGKRLKYK
jgi:transposase-like protein